MGDQKVDLIKKTYSKTEYSKVIDTKFSQLGVVSLNEQIENTVTVNQFFESYNNLFYDIPALGETNSHEYLIKTSGEYINFDQDSQEIEALRAEITSLRRDLLQAQVEKAEALTGEKIDLDVNAIEDSSIAGDDFAKISQEVSSPAVNTTNTSVV
jgi:hypothetical protein|tara:strand:- start:95 stop:559 length:465 start_codon:yes stop_codon:yes gene_type:complete